MNHPTRPTYAAHLREACKQPSHATHDSKQLKLLDALVDKIMQSIDDNSCIPKVGDALKAIQLREKVAKNSEGEQIFWQMIEDIRAEEPPGSDPQFTNLQRQIQAAILPLRDSVKNAVLRVKAITEVFNDSRSEAARLTTRRMGKLLAGMGFTMVKASNGSSAILWDDDLLPPHPPPEPAERPCRSGCPSPYRPAGGLQGDAAEGGGATRQSAEGAGEGMDFSSPLAGEELKERGRDSSSPLVSEEPKSKIPPFGRLSSSLSDLPSTLSLRTKCGVEDRVVSKTLSQIERSEVEPPSAEETGNSTRQDFIQGIDEFPQNPPTPLPWDNTESVSSPTHPPIHPGSPPRHAASCGKLRIEKNKNKSQNPLKALKHQFPASRDPPKR